MRRNSEQNPTLLRVRSVTEQTGLSRSSLYKEISTGDFPKPVKITAKAVAWPSDEVDAWIQKRIELSRKKIIDGNELPQDSDNSTITRKK